MKLHPIAQEILTIFMEALGLVPMRPAPVRVKGHLDASACSGSGVDALE